MDAELSKYLPSFFQGLGQFLGVFLGVIAGTAVTILTHYCFNRARKKQELANLLFELNLNSKKLNNWLEELTKYRNAVNGDSLLYYFGYFKLSSVIGITMYQLHTSGRLYKLLTHEQIEKIQEAFSTLAISGENYLNNQIEQRKQALKAFQESGQQQLWNTHLKPIVVKDIDFWEGKFKEYLSSFQEIVIKLKKK